MAEAVQEPSAGALRLLARMDHLGVVPESINPFISRTGESGDITTWLALGVAALAVFFAPLVQLSIAKRQIRASVLSGNRQRWIDQLRANIAEFLALSFDLLAEVAVGGEDFQVKLVRLQQLQFTIRLMLNPKESDHQELISLLGKVMDAITKPRGPAAKAAALWPLVEQVNVTSLTILKREWERVK